MVYTCCIPGCKTRYKSNTTSQKISLFRFPKNESLNAEWIKVIPLENWTVTDLHRVCANHFHDQDFETESTDHRESRKGSRDTPELKKSSLKANAILRVFTGLPTYLSKELPASRITSKSTAAARHADENMRLEEQIERAFAKDQVIALHSLKLKLSSVTLPSGFVFVNVRNCLHFIYLPCSDEKLIASKLAATVTVAPTLDVQLFVHSTPMPKIAYKHLLRLKTVSSITELCNILALCKVLSETADSVKSDFTCLVNSAVSSLQ